MDGVQTPAIRHARNINSLACLYPYRLKNPVKTRDLSPHFMNEAKPCLLVLDVIVDIVSPGGQMASCANHAVARDMVGKVNKALNFARQSGWPVAMVRVAFLADYSDAPKHSPIFARAQSLGALLLGTAGTDWLAALEVHASDHVFVKKGISAFADSGLDRFLRERNVDTLLVCGVSSLMAVEATVRAGHDLGYACGVIEDACAAPDETLHQRAMQVCSMLGKVFTAADLAVQFAGPQTSP